VSVEWGEWFYLPPGFWESSRFWRALRALTSRYVPCVGVPGPEEVDELVPEPARARYGSQAQLRRTRRRVALVAEWQIARLEQDADRARRLARRYPAWREARELAAGLPSS